MTGISEILVLVLLIAGILILPRFFKSEPARDKNESSPLKKIQNLSAKARFSIFLSLVYPLAMALYLKPWKTDPSIYILLGIVPVVIVWSIVWILKGRKNT